MNQTIDSKLDKILAILSGVDGRVGSLEDRFDKLEVRFDSLEQRFVSVEHKTEDVSSRLSLVERSLESLTDLVKKVDQRTREDSDAHAFNYYNLHKRVRKLERLHNTP